MSGIAIMFQIRRDRLPDATRFEHIRELRAQEENLLAERRAERDVALKQIEEAKTSIALEAARKIERDNLTKEVEDLRREKEPLETLRQEADRIRAARDALTEEIARLEARKARLELEPGSE